MLKLNGLTRSHCLSVWVIAVLSLAMLIDPAHADTVTFAIEPQDLSGALKAFAVQSHREIFFAPELARGRKSQGVKGQLDDLKALNIILEGTGLNFSVTASNAILVRDPTSKNEPSRSTALPASVTAADPPVRVAQVDQATAGPPAVADEQNAEKKRKEEGLSEIVVTGSRLPSNGQRPQEILVYTKEQIDQSGQTTVADFLNTLPSVSVSMDASGQLPNEYGGAATVQLRGLPVGTTLVLINGRRVETSGSQAGANFFDLNNIPLGTIDRIEVMADGSSAVYGSDAIAGVVNIILKKDYDGLAVNAKYGFASGTEEKDADASWGRKWDQGSISVTGSYQIRGALDNSARAITANNNYAAFGGPNNNLPVCTPGNVFSADGVTPLPGLGNATYAAVPNGFTGKPSIGEFQNTAGTLNECSIFAGRSLIPETHRGGFYAQGDYEISPSLQLFAELMYSHVQVYQYTGYQEALIGLPGYQAFTVSASNPHNPFGTTVGISDALTSIPPVGQFLDTTFLRPVVGARGNFSSSWTWEISAWESHDHTDNPLPQTIVNTTGLQNALNSSNPATALNPFIAGPIGTPAQLQSYFSEGLDIFAGQTQMVSGFARGPALMLPAGPVEVVVGSEYESDKLSSDYVNDGFHPPNTETTYDRRNYAIFGEAHIPILADHLNPQLGDKLAVTLAARHDNYDEFGSKNTPQYGVEWRPLESLHTRGTYAQSFKAPSLYDLYAAQTKEQSPVTDPLTGKLDVANIISGGNPELRPETGHSYTFGMDYDSKAIPDLKISITQWHIDENNLIEPPSAIEIMNNPAAFPGAIVRGPSGPDGQPGPITTLNLTNANFGQISVSGLDYQINYHYQSDLGTWSPSLSAAQTYHYTAALVAGTPATERVSIASDDGNWAPRWKGTAALGWKLGPYSASVDGRYVSKYQDYDSTREIGNFWIFDGNLRFAIGEVFAPTSDVLKGAYCEVGGVNLFNNLPQFSNFGGGFLGYDPREADIRGRFLYVNVGMRL